MSRQVQIMVRGPAGPSGAPAEVKVEMVLTWDEVMHTVRHGAFPERVVDDVMVDLLAIGSRR